MNDRTARWLRRRLYRRTRLPVKIGGWRVGVSSAGRAQMTRPGARREVRGVISALDLPLPDRASGSAHAELGS